MPVLPLPVAMVQPSFRAPLVTAVGAAPLVKPGLGPAGGTAITLPAVTVPTDPEHRVGGASAVRILRTRSAGPGGPAHGRYFNALAYTLAKALHTGRK